jgi:biotin/methionine sulfoxide reductase
VITLNSQDAAARGIRGGEVVRVFNERGELLAAAAVSADVRASVVSLPTGAWFDPAVLGPTGALEKHGNPNVLTPDRGTSRLAQGPTAHSTLVQVELFEGEVPPVTAFVPPQILVRGAS